MAWDSAQYLRYASPRIRPGLDLLDRVPIEDPKTVIDLGCGPGNLTAVLAERWPDAQVVGLDSSAPMLDRARADHPAIEWVEADINKWSPSEPVDVIYSNATLHWLDDHAHLLPRLLGCLTPGGTLAIQMPHPDHQASHVAILDVVEDGAWASRLRPLLRRGYVGEMAWYRDLLAPLCAEVDIWESHYLHVLEGDNAVAEWTRGSALRPLLAELNEDEADEFWRLYSDRVRAAYPPSPDGKALLTYRRVFLTASASP
ncbi:MAG: methyltransferase domain-containing protein [Actinomycetia bacterium]|nr:methyltransferase domain-containing protein [Actinomycetes bacterium]